jgi:hypothetical protein
MIEEFRDSVFTFQIKTIETKILYFLRIYWRLLFVILWYRHHFLQSAILYRVTNLMSSFFEHSVDEVEDVVIKPLISGMFNFSLTL